MTTLHPVRTATTRGRTLSLRLIAALAVFLALLPVAARPSGASGTASLTLHVSRCPAGYAGPTYFDVCHERWFGGVIFAASGPLSFTATTPRSGPEKGVVARERLTPGTYSIGEQFPVGTLDFLVYCSLWDPNLRVPIAYTSNGIRLTLKAGQAVLCDWFHVPAKATATTNLNLRVGPSTDHAILRVIPQGRRVELTGQSANGFLSVRFKGIDGWAFGRFLRRETVTVSPTTDLNLRAGPSTRHDIVAVMSAGALVQLTGRHTDGFLSVRFRGVDGWASARFLLTVDP